MTREALLAHEEPGIEIAVTAAAAASGFSTTWSSGVSEVLSMLAQPAIAARRTTGHGVLRGARDGGDDLLPARST